MISAVRGWLVHHVRIAWLRLEGVHEDASTQPIDSSQRRHDAGFVLGAGHPDFEGLVLVIISYLLDYDYAHITAGLYCYLRSLDSLIADIIARQLIA